MLLRRAKLLSFTLLVEWKTYSSYESSSELAYSDSINDYAFFMLNIDNWFNYSPLYENLAVFVKLLVFVFVKFSWYLPLSITSKNEDLFFLWREDLSFFFSDNAFMSSSFNSRQSIEISFLSSFVSSICKLSSLTSREVFFLRFLSIFLFSFLSIKILS